MKRIMTAHSDHGLETSYLEKAGENNNHTVSIIAAHFCRPYTVFTQDGKDKQPEFPTLLQPIAQK